MDVFISGATGLVGRRLVADCLAQGDRVRVLSRNADRARRAFGNLDSSRIEVVEGDPGERGPWCDRISGCHGVVHLAGAGILARRWTAEYKRTLVRSRVQSTQCVVEAMNAADDPPRILVCASAIGRYGECGDRIVDEDSAPAQRDFMVDLVEQWEAAAAEFNSASSRAVSVRTGIVLDPRGGMLEAMLRPFRLFAGGPLLPGSQYLSWIHWRDLIGVFRLALTTDALRGPVNGTAPKPERMREFCRTLGRVIGRPSWLPVPQFATRLALGEVAGHISASARVIPKRALEAGYEFEYPDLQSALEALLG